jgi:Protein of unknown function (DUF3040)
MSLSGWEQQTLDSIGAALAGSDPDLAVLLATFSELASGEEMPAAEQVRPGPHLAGWRAGRRRRRPHRGVIRRCGSWLARVLTLRWGVALLWLAITVALIATAVALSGGTSQETCARPWSAVCTSTVPARTSQPAAQSAVTSIPAQAARQ